MSVLDERRKILEAHGAEGETVDELIAYNNNVFVQKDGDEPTFPLSDEKHITFWEQEYCAREGSAFEAMRAELPQLNFPIQEGISERDGYVDVTRKGLPFKDCTEASGLDINDPGGIDVTLYQTDGGRIPVISIGNRGDFVTVVRAILKRGEPVPIPDSLGAYTVVGFNNWHRIHKARQQWEVEHTDGDFWRHRFPEFRRDKSNYSDTFIILSQGPYSGVAAEELDLDEGTWLKLSYLIRREHEATHYFTRRVFASMRNNIIDEILADYMGIVAAQGYFRRDWILAFFGLSNYPKYRQGGRLEYYCSELSSGAFAVVTSLVVAAVRNLEEFDRVFREPLAKQGVRARLIMALTRLTLEQLAAPSAFETLKHYTRIEHMEGPQELT